MLWKDSETKVDFLNFKYLSDQVVEIALDKNLSPATIGIYGDWGSGKSSLMEMVKEELENNITQEKILIVDFNGWTFEGYEDAKTALCGSILDELANLKGITAEVKDRILALIKKVDVNKIVSKGIKYGIDFALTGGIGTLSELTLAGLVSAVKSKVTGASEEEVKLILDALKNEESKRASVKNFSKEFKILLDDSKVDHVVVFIDELDRCLPDTILDIFEALRLFLYVPGTTFIIGADQRMVQYAVKTRYKDIPGNEMDISKEYMEKLIQYPVKIPQLNEKEVKQYISCLLLQKDLGEDFKKITDVVNNLTIDEELSTDLLKGKYDECFAERCKEALDLAHQISSVLAFIMKGNPRHCKRFLNTLFMRLSMAKSRHVNLNRKVLAKLMMVELYKSSFYDLLEDKNNKEDLKHLEDGKYESIQGEISKWISDTWIQEWAQNSPKLYQVDLAPYYYFSREKRRYKSSSMANLRPEVRKALEGLLSGTSKGLNDVLKISNDMLPVEREEIANVLFEEMNKDEKLDKKILKAYVEFMIASNLTLEAKNCLMSIPASKFETGNIGTISQLFDKLENKDRGELADYLKTNQTIASQVVTTIKLLNK